MTKLDELVTKLTGQVNALVDSALVGSLDNEELSERMCHIRSLCGQIFNHGRSVECEECADAAGP